MIFVSAFYVVSDTPMDIYYLLVNINVNLTLLESGYYAAMFISFLYICANPFIYATNFDPVKRVLLGLIPCKKTSVQPIESVEMKPAARTPMAQSSKTTKSDSTAKT